MIGNWPLLRRAGVEERGIRLALAMVTLLVKINKQINRNNTHPRIHGNQVAVHQ